MSDFVPLLYFGGTFILHSQLLRSEKQFFNNEVQATLSSSCDICVLHQSTGAPDGSLSESLKAWAPRSGLQRATERSKWQELTLNNPITEGWGREEMLTLVQFQT